MHKDPGTQSSTESPRGSQAPWSACRQRSSNAGKLAVSMHETSRRSHQHRGMSERTENSNVLSALVQHLNRWRRRHGGRGRAFVPTEGDNMWPPTTRAKNRNKYVGCAKGDPHSGCNWLMSGLSTSRYPPQRTHTQLLTRSTGRFASTAARSSA